MFSYEQSRQVKKVKNKKNHSGVQNAGPEESNLIFMHVRRICS